MSRLTRREMKRDELVTTLARLSIVVEEHTKSIMIAIVAVVVLAVAVTAGVVYSHSRDRAARAALADVYRAATAPVTGLIGSGIYPTTEAKYKEVIHFTNKLLETYPSSRSAEWAVYWKGLGLMELGRGDEALEVLGRLDDSHDKGFIYWSAQFLKARVQESRGNLEDAGQTYLDIADAAPEQFPVEMALMNRARLLDKQGKSDEALEAYRRVSRDYPDSPFARTATLNLTRAGDESF